MVEKKRLLLVLNETRDNTQILLEIADSNIREELARQASSYGLECSLIGLEEYDRATYRGSRYFDLRNSLTLKNFQLHDWIDFLKHWDENERNDKFGL